MEETRHLLFRIDCESLLSSRENTVLGGEFDGFLSLPSFFCKSEKKKTSVILKCFASVQPQPVGTV